jgi:hypothetical protein
MRVIGIPAFMDVGNLQLKEVIKKAQGAKTLPMKPRAAWRDG